MFDELKKKCCLRLTKVLSRHLSGVTEEDYYLCVPVSACVFVTFLLSGRQEINPFKYRVMT
jgi:hypothetical protein